MKIGCTVVRELPKTHMIFQPPDNRKFKRNAMMLQEGLRNIKEEKSGWVAFQTLPCYIVQKCDKAEGAYDRCGIEFVLKY